MDCKFLHIFFFIIYNFVNVVLAQQTTQQQQVIQPDECNSVHPLLSEMFGLENMAAIENSYPKNISCCNYNFITCDMGNTKVIEIDFSSFSNRVLVKKRNNAYPNNSLPKFPSLETLNLKNLKLSSGVDDNLEKFPNLKKLDLSSNELKGIIPRSIGALKNLITIDISNNKFTGEIPDTIITLSGLTSLKFSNNGLIKSIPGEIGSMIGLKDLYLNNNSLEGTIPKSLENLDELIYLDLHSNKLNGGLINITRFKNLVTLNLGENNIQGNLPKDINKMTLIRNIDLGDNLFSGYIPESIGDLNYLTSLYLQKNSFQGVIPSSISKLERLETIDVSSNFFKGPIPQLSSNVRKCDFNNTGTGNTFCSKEGVKNVCLNEDSSLFKTCTSDELKLKNEDSDEGSTTLTVLYIGLGILAVIAICVVAYYVYKRVKQENEVNEILEKVSIKSNSKIGYNEKEIFNDGSEEESHQDNLNQSLPVQSPTLGNNNNNISPFFYGNISTTDPSFSQQQAMFMNMTNPNIFQYQNQFYSTSPNGLPIQVATSLPFQTANAQPFQTTTTLPFQANTTLPNNFANISISNPQENGSNLTMGSSSIPQYNTNRNDTISPLLLPLQIEDPNQFNYHDHEDNNSNNNSSMQVK